MKSTQFYTLMHNPSLLSEETIEELHDLLRDYPYFGAARLLYLKNRAIFNPIAYKREITTAIFALHPHSLFSVIEVDRHAWAALYHLTDAPTVETQEAKEDHTYDIIDSFLEKYAPTTQGEDIDQLLAPTETYYSLDALLSLDDEIVETANVADNEQINEKSVVIDDFLQKAAAAEPLFKIKVENVQETPYLSDLEIDNEEEESLFSESLAKIYIKQKKYNKALEIIQKLYLKYPEKNCYFADQIRFLEKLIINTKKIS